MSVDHCQLPRKLRAGYLRSQGPIYATVSGESNKQTKQISSSSTMPFPPKSLDHHAHLELLMPAGLHLRKNLNGLVSGTADSSPFFSVAPRISITTLLSYCSNPCMVSSCLAVSHLRAIPIAISLLLCQTSSFPHCPGGR